MRAAIGALLGGAAFCVCTPALAGGLPSTSPLLGPGVPYVTSHHGSHAIGTPRLGSILKPCDRAQGLAACPARQNGIRDNHLIPPFPVLQAISLGAGNGNGNGNRSGNGHDGPTGAPIGAVLGSSGSSAPVTISGRPPAATAPPPVVAPGEITTTAPSTPTPPPAPPVVAGSFGPSGPAELISAVTTGWGPLALVIALFAIVLFAVVFTGRRHQDLPQTSTG